MRPKIAAVVTEYRINSHADVIVTKFLEGCDMPDGGRWEPQGDIVSLYTDQVPANDMSREMAKKHNVPLFDTIHGALTLGTETLAVDGVLLIGEHGNYPYNEKGQHLYPRRRFFEETVKTFQFCGRVVPVFNDKHLSYSWENAKWMYETARQMHIPFMAGSSLPVTWRKPPLELPLDCALEDALAVGYGDVEAYGFHALETLQCMIERRRGGESGVKAVQCLMGDEVWQAGDAGRWSWKLLQAALATDPKSQAGDVRANVKEPVAFMMEHGDGLQSCVLMLNGQTSEFLFACKLKGQILATDFWLQDGRPFAHFARLNDAIQKMFLTGKPTYPVERTLLTTGVLAFLMESKFQGGKRLETPELAVKYRVEG
ncbi:MAG: hypothetical protein NZT92_05150 [Abditibacteriales bacterium]|nr:hypothetical protein [Abditibacteriales bacterium]MDW8365307.1 hypothetical protein [Abditibacteriales bacterium]